MVVGFGSMGFVVRVVMSLLDWAEEVERDGDGGDLARGVDDMAGEAEGGEEGGEEVGGGGLGEGE